MKEPKKIKSIDPLSGTMMTMEAVMGTRTQDRTNALRYETEDCIVDTCCAFDTNTWETGIDKGCNGDWKIVEQYEDKNEAKKGHRRWVKRMKKNPNRELKDVGVWDGMED